MKQFFIQIVLLLIVLFGALLYQTGKLPGFYSTNSLSVQPVVEPVKKAQMTIKKITLNVEIADTTAKRSQGLGGRTSLATDSGMLFEFPDTSNHVFWMKGMKFPLDFIWISDNKVVDLTKNAPVPSPGQTDNDLPRFQPSQPVNQVLEVNAGFIDSHNIQVGDEVSVK